MENGKSVCDGEAMRNDTHTQIYFKMFQPESNRPN